MDILKIDGKITLKNTLHMYVIIDSIYHTQTMIIEDDVSQQGKVLTEGLTVNLNCTCAHKQIFAANPKIDTAIFTW